MKKEDYRLQITDYRFLFLLFSVLCSLFSVSYAKEITIIYTGETHAMLYPCNCPKEPDGGVARRATLIKQLKKKNPNTLLLDSGGFFAGGLTDEYTQNIDLDKERTRVNLKAMNLMGYDAVAIGDDEFNFGREFLEENIAKSNFPYLACNIKSQEISPYIIKEISGTKFGIIGLTGLSAIQKAEGLKFVEPKIAVRQAIEALKKSGVNIIVLLSHLGENENTTLIKEIEGIDILIVGHTRSKDEPSTKIGPTLGLRPSWQGRRLGKLSLTITDNKIANYKVEELRLSDKVSDSLEVSAILPRCFSDSNCKKKDFVGVCQEPGTLNSRCEFSEPTKVSLLVVTPRDCSICDTKTMVDYLKAQVPGLTVSYLYYPSAKAVKLVKDSAVKGLPIYLLGKEVEKEKSFANLRENLEVKGDFYMVKSGVSGISYFIDRKPIKGKLDLFISLYDKGTPELLDIIKDFQPIIHFLAIEQEKGRFDAARGNLEVEEYLKGVCVKKYYPRIFWDYITCRAKGINSSWWEDCLDEFDAQRIKNCARSDEGKNLLKDNIGLNKELQVMFGPAYLLDNREVFGTQGIPTKEELKKILKR